MFTRWVCAALIAAASFQALAAGDAEKVVHDVFAKVAPNAKITAIAKSEVPGFYQVLVDATVYFVSTDGKYIIRGNVYEVATKVDLGEKQLASLRKTELAKIPASKELVFAPANPKYTVTVFTDVDCPYCRQFHKQIAEYNKLGIAVKYVFYPLPMHPGADKKAETVWCSADRNSAYTTAMTGAWDAPKSPQSAANKPLDQALADAVKTPEKKAEAAPDADKQANAYKPLTCENPITELTNLGKSMGVDGTPAIFTAAGDHVGGYVAPDQLAKKLEELAERDRQVTAK